MIKCKGDVLVWVTDVHDIVIDKVTCVITPIMSVVGG